VAVFIGTFENKVDRKGRVSVPAAFRKAVGGQSFNGVVVFPSYRAPALEACGMELMEQLGERMGEFDLFSEDHEDLATTIFADSQQLGFDDGGRIMLPGEFMEHAGIGERAAFVGKGRMFQIWEPEALAREKEAARQRARERKLTLPLKAGGKEDS
jgi:MraZ protein